MKTSDKSRAITVIAVNLKRLRGAKGISQGALARKAGLRLFVYSKIENGKGSPKVSDLEHIADVLGVNLKALVTPVPPIKFLRFRLSDKPYMGSPVDAVCKPF